MPAGIDLQEHTLLGEALPPQAMGRRPSAARAGQSGLEQDTPDGAPAQHHAFLFRQHIGEVAMIGGRIPLAGQGQDPAPHRGSECMAGTPPTVPVGHRRKPFLAVCRQNPSDLPHAHSQDDGCLCTGTRSAFHLLDHAKANLVSGRQCHLFHRVTFSQHS